MVDYTTKICIRYFSVFENLMTSTERIVEYTNIKSEQEYNNELIEYNNNNLNNWPKNGSIKFVNVSVKFVII